MKKIFRSFLFFCLTIFFVFICLGLAITGSGAWLLRGIDQPSQADAIIVLAGDPSRAIFAAELYKKGFAPLVYVSKPVRGANLKLLDELGVETPLAEEVYRKVLLKKGVPDSAIKVLGAASISTVQEADEMKKIFPEKQKLLVVTSPYHVRRTKMILKSKLGKYRIIVVATPYGGFTFRWWKDQDSAVAVVTELAKIVFYKSGGAFHR